MNIIEHDYVYTDRRVGAAGAGLNWNSGSVAPVNLNRGIAILQWVAVSLSASGGTAGPGALIISANSGLSRFIYQGLFSAAAGAVDRFSLSQLWAPSDPGSDIYFQTDAVPNGIWTVSYGFLLRN